MRASARRERNGCVMEDSRLRNRRNKYGKFEVDMRLAATKTRCARVSGFFKFRAGVNELPNVFFWL